MIKIHHMKNGLVVLMLLTVQLLLVSCATTKSVIHFHEAIPPDDNTIVIYVYRLKSMVGAMVPWAVRLDGKVVANLNQQAYTVLYTTPGEHSVTLGDSEVAIFFAGDPLGRATGAYDAINESQLAKAAEKGKLPQNQVNISSVDAPNTVYFFRSSGFNTEYVSREDAMNEIFGMMYEPSLSAPVLSAEAISASPYVKYNCEQLKDELIRVDDKLAEAMGVQKSKKTKKIIATALFWPSHFIMKDGQKDRIESLKSQAIAIEQAVKDRKCDTLLAEIDTAKESARESENKTDERMTTDSEPAKEKTPVVMSEQSIKEEDQQASGETGVTKEFVISDKGFEARGGGTGTDVDILGVSDTEFSVRTKSIAIGGGGINLWCDGAIHKWIGKLTYNAYTFDSDKDTPLTFQVVKGKGYVFIKGKGTVILPDGKKVILPLKNTAGNETVASANTLEQNAKQIQSDSTTNIASPLEISVASTAYKTWNSGDASYTGWGIIVSVKNTTDKYASEGIRPVEMKITDTSGIQYDLPKDFAYKSVKLNRGFDGRFSCVYIVFGSGTSIQYREGESVISEFSGIYEKNEFILFIGVEQQKTINFLFIFDAPAESKLKSLIWPKSKPIALP